MNWVNGEVITAERNMTDNVPIHHPVILFHDAFTLSTTYASSPNDRSALLGFFAFFFVPFFVLPSSLSSSGSPTAFRLPVDGLNPALDDENERLGVLVLLGGASLREGIGFSSSLLETTLSGSGSGARPLSDNHAFALGQILLIEL